MHNYKQMELTETVRLLVDSKARIDVQDLVGKPFLSNDRILLRHSVFPADLISNGVHLA